MDKHDLKGLTAAFPGLCLRDNVSWKEITYLGVGVGSVTLAEPNDDIELAALLKYCHGQGIGVYILGAGSNIVGSDKPFGHLVIRLCRNDFTRIMPSHVHVVVGSGTKLGDFLRKCAAMGLGGAPGLAGIPGTVGGAIRMNAGAHGVEIKDIVEELCGFAPDGSQWSMDASDIKWGYRHVELSKDLIVTAAIFRLHSVHASSELEAIEDESKWRQSHFPSGRSSGCVFRNPLFGVSAGKLIDEAGCRGARIGDALVSDIHANYFLNDGDSTEEDYASLIIEAKKTVLAHSGLYLVPEVCFANPGTESRILAEPEVVRVLVLKGGDSNERAISLVSGEEVGKGLESAGYHVDSYDI
ncbi:MAG: UDP-N-acetylmuramate dehydrogenase, partial [Victivallales bacterium]|nr:UDP-N-acetylmuramate dehydrogenase [Victivallales bacterium]